RRPRSPAYGRRSDARSKRSTRRMPGRAPSTARRRRSFTSCPLHEIIDNALLARPVEHDGELVAVDGRDVAVSKFLVKHAVADSVVRDRAGGLGNQLAFDGARRATLAGGGIARCMQERLRAALRALINRKCC